MRKTTQITRLLCGLVSILIPASTLFCESGFAESPGDWIAPSQSRTEIGTWFRPVEQAKTFEQLERMITPLLFTKDRDAFRTLIRSFPPSASPRIQWTDGKLRVSDGSETLWLRPTNFDHARFELNGGVYQWVPWESMESQIAILRKSPYLMASGDSSRPHSEKLLGMALGSLLFAMRKQSDGQGRQVELKIDTQEGKRLEWTCDRIRNEITADLKAGEKAPEEKLLKLEKLQALAVRNVQTYCDGSENRKVPCQQARDLLGCTTEALGLTRKARQMRD